MCMLQTQVLSRVRTLLGHRCKDQYEPLQTNLPGSCTTRITNNDRCLVLRHFWWCVIYISISDYHTLSTCTYVLFSPFKAISSLDSGAVVKGQYKHAADATKHYMQTNWCFWLICVCHFCHELCKQVDLCILILDITMVHGQGQDFPILLD